MAVGSVAVDRNILFGGFAMFGFGKRGISEIEMWGIVFKAAALITAQEQQTRNALPPNECMRVIKAACAEQPAQPSREQEKIVEMAVQALAGTNLIKNMLARWIRDKSNDFSQDDIRLALAEIEQSVQGFLRTRPQS